MAKNNSYSNTSYTLGVENRSLEGIIYHPTKPVLDSELNGITDIHSSRLQDAIRSEVPSGWLDANYTIGYDSSYTTYGVNTTNTPNVFYLNSLKRTPTIAVVNGWILQVGGTGIANNSILKITLPSPPSTGSRSDLVFLEVWKAELKANPVTTGKPTSSQVYTYGNTQYSGTNLAEEIINTAIGFETATRVQLQYRIRVVSGVNFNTNPEGIDDPTAFAQGNRTSVSTYNFTNAGSSLDDYGLYVAGDGSPTAMASLGTVDGYVYAIPMFRVQRRNISDFSNSNQNGSAYSLASSITDRPDGLYNDQVDKLDIEDLRHKVTFGEFNHPELLEYNLDKILSGESNAILTTSELDNNLERTNLGFFINTVASSPQANTLSITTPNGQQRYFSDAENSIYVESVKTINDKYLGTNGVNWSSTDQIKVSSMTLLANINSGYTPLVKFSQTTSGPVCDIPNGSWSFSSTEAIFTLGSLTGTASGLVAQNLHITFLIDYPQYSQNGYKLTKPIKEMLQVKNNSEKWGFISTTSTVASRKISARTTNNNTDYANVYKVSSSNYYGIGTLYSYFMNGAGDQTFIIPGTLINSQDLGYVLAAYYVDGATYLDMSNIIRQPTNGDITVTLPMSIDPGETMRFDVVVYGGVLEFDERTQTITDMGYVDMYQVTGNNTDTIYLNAENLVIDVQREYYTNPAYINVYYPVANPYKTVCYKNNQREFCDIIPVANTSFVKLKFSGAVLASDTITLSVFNKKALSTLVNDNLVIYYNYKEYKGITKKTNFGSVNDSIYSKIMYHNNRLSIVTNGTGAINSSTVLPKKYELLLPMIPTHSEAYLGKFIGTVHTSKPIIGGSYSGTVDYSAPYSCGKLNYLSVDSFSKIEGSYFTSVAEDGEGSIQKIVMSSLLEMVISDNTKNFLPGELGLKIETNYINSNVSNKISTNRGEPSNYNIYDMFKLEGKPLYKVKNKGGNYVG